jgi:hypothetical protein
MWMIGALLCVAASLPSAGAQGGELIIGVGGQLFFDDVDLVGERKVAVLSTDEGYAASSDGLMSGSLWVLKGLGKGLYVGGQIQYYGSYTTAPEEERNNDTRVKAFGQLLELSGRGEWMYEVMDKVSVGLGAQLGLVMLFPGDDFEKEIDALRDQGASVSSAGTPRLGYLVGPSLAARWRFMEPLALRLDLGLKWEQVYLFKTEEKIGGIPFRKDWQLDLIRYEVGVGLEVVL